MDLNKLNLLSPLCKGNIGKHWFFENALAYYFSHREGVCIKDQIYLMKNLPDAYCYYRTLNCYVFHKDDLKTIAKIINNIWENIDVSVKPTQKRHIDNIELNPSIFTKAIQTIISYMRM